jgi:hypothetical protein
MDTALRECRFTGGTLFWRLALMPRQLSEGIVHRLCFALPHPGEKKRSDLNWLPHWALKKAPEVFVL